MIKRLQEGFSLADQEPFNKELAFQLSQSYVDNLNADLEISFDADKDQLRFRVLYFVNQIRLDRLEDGTYREDFRLLLNSLSDL